LTAWDELIDEFRALGGTADNIRLGQGDYGRGLFPIDPTKPVAIRAPENLLVNVGDIVFENGAPRIGPDAKVSSRERAWLDIYLKEFGWDGGGADEIRKIFEAAGQLSPELRNKLLTEYGCGVWFSDPSDELIEKRFIHARSIDYAGRAAVMPVVEMANHGAGERFESVGGMSLKGVFSGEVLAEYSPQDAHSYFHNWGFATKRPVAFSVALAGKIDSTTLEIDQQFEETKKAIPQMWVPKIEKSAEKVALQFLLIGNRRFPRVPKGIFYQMMRDAGYQDVEEAFDVLHHLNRLFFLNLLSELNDIDLPMAHTVRSMALHQLNAMSYCFGVREF
jgi:hypothetical protein